MASTKRKSNPGDGAERTGTQKLDSYDVPRGGGRLALMGTAYATAWVLGLELSPEAASVRFFEVAAQVIPVLISVGGTSSGPPEYRHASIELWGRFLFPLALLGALIASELRALGVVADPTTTNAHDPGFVYGGLCAAFAAILLIAVIPPAAAAERSEEAP